MIRFNTEEIGFAGTDLLAEQCANPRESCLDIKIVEHDKAVTAIITLPTKKAGLRREQVLTAEFLCAALIRACRLWQVPLPRKGQKRVVKAGETLALRVELKTEISRDSLSDQAPTLPPKAKALRESPATDFWVTGIRKA